MKVSVKKARQLNGHQGSIYTVINGVASDSIFTAGSDKTIVEWHSGSEEAHIFARFPVSVYSLLLLTDKRVLLAGLGDGRISIIDCEKKQELKLLLQHHKAIFDLKYSAIHKLVVAASADGSISFIDSINFKCEKIIKLCDEKIRCIDFNATQTEMSVACGDGSIRFFELKSRTEISRHIAHVESANVVSYHPNGKHLLTGGKDAMLCIWKINSDKLWQVESKIPAHNFAIYSLSFHPKLKLFATGSRDKTIKLWDAETFDFLIRINKENFEAHTYSVNKILWTESSNQLVSIGDDKTTMLWNILKVD